MTPFRIAIPSALVLVLAFAAAAQAQPAPANPSPAAVQAGSYAVEPEHTRVMFSVMHMGFTRWYGDFTKTAGTLTLDPKAPATAKVNVTVQTGSVATTNAKLDGELRDPTWFDAAKFPTITFRSTKVTPTGPGKADVAGDFTLHGVTRPLVLHASFNGGGANPMSKAYTIGFQGTGRIKRSDFGVAKYVPLVGDEVEITISAAFEKR